MNKHKRATPGEGGSSSLQTGDAVPRDGVETSAADTQAPIVESSWDPYQVWLTRVKQPREESARRQSRPIPVEPVKTTDLSETARLRALTAALPR